MSRRTLSQLETCFLAQCASLAFALFLFSTFKLFPRASLLSLAAAGFVSGVGGLLCNLGLRRLRRARVRKTVADVVLLTHVGAVPMAAKPPADENTSSAVCHPPKSNSSERQPALSPSQSG